MSLTRGVIKEILSCSNPEDLPVNPVVQILAVKKVSRLPEGQVDQYRLVLSDGLHYYTSALLSPQLNHLVEDNMVEVKAVIQMNSYTCDILQDTRKVIILLGVTLIHRASEIEGKIGEPAQLNENLSDSSGTKKEAQPRRVMEDQTPEPADYFESRNAAQPSPGKNNGSPQNKVSDGNATASNARNIFPISSLSPYQRRWTIRARITSKPRIKPYKTRKGAGKLFNIDLIDESGEIRAKGFDDIADKYYDMVEVGKVYFISKGRLEMANKRYSSLQNDYEIVINSDTAIELCSEECKIPSLKFNFKQIKDTEQLNKDDVIDVVGIVTSAADVTQITTKATNKQVPKRDLTMVDQSNASIRVTIWDEEAQRFQEYVDRTPVIAIKGAKISDFGGRSLSVLSSGVFQINPDIPEAHALREWFADGGIEQQMQSLTGQGMIGESGFYKCIGHIKDENLGMGGVPDYFNVRAMCVFLRKENCLYQGCPAADCKKKVTDEGGQYRCEKCDRTYPDFKYRLTLKANIADFSGNQWITLFQESAEVMLGVSAEELGRMRDEDESQFEKIFAEASFKPFVFRIKAKMTMYQDEARIECSSVSTRSLNANSECKRLLKEIERLQAI